MGLILDSSVAIAAERHGDTVTAMLKQIVATRGDQWAVLSALGLTELVHGIYREQTAEARNRRDAFVRELLNDVDVYPCTKDTRCWPEDSTESSRAEALPFQSSIL